MGRGADARAADEDAPLGPATLQRGAELHRLVRIVDPVRVGVRAEIDDAVALLPQHPDHAVAQVDAAVVEGDGDVHGRPSD